MSNTAPVGWEKCNLAEVCYFQEGPGLRKWQYTKEGFPFINIRCIREGYLDLKNVQYISWDEANQRYQHFFLNEGDYVLSSSGTLGRMAKIKKTDLPLMLNTSVIRFRSTDKTRLFHDFLPHYLQSPEFVDQITEESQGSAQVNFGPTHLTLVECILPPVLEQKKIATVLSSVDDVIEKTRAQIDKLKDLKTGMMQELLTKGVGHTEFKDSPVGRIPVSWEVHSLSELTTKISDGIHTTPTYTDKSEYCFVNGNNLKEGFIIFGDKTKFVPEQEYVKHRKDLNENTILMSINGTIGNLALYRGEKVILGKSAAYISLKENQSKHFIYYVLQSQWVKKFYELELTGSTISNLSLRSIKDTPVPVPPKREQVKIASIIEGLDDLLRRKLKKLDSLSNVKTSLMQDLLTGKVRVNVEQKESAVA